MTTTASSSLRVALVGCGRIAPRHAAALTGSEVPGASLCAVCDILGNRAQEFGEKYAVPSYILMQEMIEAEKPDLVAILTPSGQHARHILALCEYGIPLLVEKPLVLTMEDGRAVVEACEEFGTPLGVVKQNRYNVAVQILRQMVDDGDLGEIHTAAVRVRWRRDPDYYADWHGKWAMAGGVLANQTIHHVDLLQWLAGPVQSVSGFASHRPYTEVEVGLVAALKFWSGALGTIECSTLTAPCDLEGSLSLLGSAGTVELGGFAVNRIVTWQVPGHPMLPDFAGENPPDVYGFGHRALYQDIVRRFGEGMGFPTTGYEALESLAIVNAIYEAVETGDAVPVSIGADYPFSRLG